MKNYEIRYIMEGVVTSVVTDSLSTINKVAKLLNKLAEYYVIYDRTDSEHVKVYTTYSPEFK